MVAQCGKYLAGHEGPERDDPAILHLGPFRVGARQNEAAFPPPHQRQRAHDLAFLAAHDVGDAGLVDGVDAGNDINGSQSGDRERRHLRGKLVEAGRTTDIGDLVPALAAADHPGQHRRQCTVRGQPLGAQAEQHVTESSLLDARHALRRDALVEDATIGAQQIDAQRRRAPIGRDQCCLRVVPSRHC